MQTKVVICSPQEGKQTSTNLNRKLSLILSLLFIKTFQSICMAPGKVK